MLTKKIILPIGSIVKLIESDSKVIITGHKIYNKSQDYTYDYSGSEHPYGENKNLYFDNCDINSILKFNISCE